VVKLGCTGELVLNQPGTTMTGAAQATTAQAHGRTVRVGSLGGATIILLCIVTDQHHARREMGST
jgi:hypothetical protein